MTESESPPSKASTPFQTGEPSAGEATQPERGDWRAELDCFRARARRLNRLTVTAFVVSLALLGFDAATEPSAMHVTVLVLLTGCVAALALIRYRAFRASRLTVLLAERRLTESEARDASLRRTLEDLTSVCATNTGPDLFRSLAQQLVTACDADIVVIAEAVRPDPLLPNAAPRLDLRPDPRPRRSARTIALASRSGELPELEYDLDETPCADTYRLGFHHVVSGVASRYPKAGYLTENGIASYMGVALYAACGTPIGILALLHSKPLAEPEQVKHLLRAVAGRVGAEIERASAERALRESEARLHAMLTNSPDVAIQWCDSEGRVLLWNRASETMYGFTEDEAKGRFIDELISPDQRGRSFRQTVERMLSAGQPLGPSEFAFRRKSGEAGRSLSTVFEIPGPGTDRCIVCMDVDVTRLRRAEAEARRSQKLRAIGQLAGGIAHDFNNLLVLINGYAELLKADLDESPATAATSNRRHWVEGILESGQRAAALTTQLLTIGRQQPVAPRVLDLHRELAALERHLQELAAPAARLRVETLASVASIRIDRTQLHQILMNLVVNARDAMLDRPRPHSGEIVIHTEDAAPSGDGRAKLRLSVSDDGIGMTPEVQERMFEPFFTTKPLGKGTGLGLATVYGAVLESGGAIQVRSQPGQGTRIAIEWSVADADPSHDAPTDSANLRGGPTSSPPAPHLETKSPVEVPTLLVIDDDPAVRRLLAGVLRNAGYSVLEASGAPEARRLLADERGSHQGSRHPIQLVVTDVALQGPNGADLAQELHATIPGLRVLFVSGNAGHELHKSGLMGPTDAFLQKPFTFTALTETVRSMLASPPRSRSDRESNAPAPTGPHAREDAPGDAPRR